MDKLKAAAMSSSFWATIIAGIATALQQAGAIDAQTLKIVLTVIATYIPIRLAGDGAKKVGGAK